MTNMVKYIDGTEFREAGYLQEANRRFFHPLGLALEMQWGEGGEARITGVWDSRDDPEGINFVFTDFEGNDTVPASTAEEQKDEFLRKFENIKAEWHKRKRARVMALGYMVQPVGDHFTELDSDIVTLLGAALGEEMSKVIPVKATSDSWNKAARGILDKLSERIAGEPYNPEEVTAEEVHIIDLVLMSEQVTGARTRLEAVNMLADRAREETGRAAFYKEVFETASSALGRIASGDIPPGRTPQDFADEVVSLLAGDLGG